MSSLIAFSAAVPSCSGSGSRRKRRNENSSDSDNSGLKIPRGNFYFVLESESDIPSSEEEETESILSLQNKSTDFAKDTSDTSSKTSYCGSDFGVEFEVVSLSEKEAPFDSPSSGTDMESWRKSPCEGSASDSSERSVWADNSSVGGVEELGEGNKLPLRLRPCLKCKAPTAVHYCQRCYKVRKDFFPPRPKLNKRKKIARPLIKKKGGKGPSKVSKTEEKVESGIESGSSQEIMLSPEEKSNGPAEGDGLCNVCLKNPKNGAFVHCRWVHIYSCYECSIKIWFTSRCCPLCNGKVNKVLKVAMG